MGKFQEVQVVEDIVLHRLVELGAMRDGGGFEGLVFTHKIGSFGFQISLIKL